MRCDFFIFSLLFGFFESSFVVWCCVLGRWVFNELKLETKVREESGHYLLLACSTPACARQPALTAACILISSIRLPQWQKQISADDFIRVFSRDSRSPSFLLQRRRLLAPQSSVGRSKPCKGCFPRSQSGADFIISIAVVQNGRCLEQFSLPGRLAEHALLASSLSVCHFSHAGHSVRVQAALTPCMASCSTSR